MFSCWRQETKNSCKFSHNLQLLFLFTHSTQFSLIIHQHLTPVKPIDIIQHQILHSPGHLNSAVRPGIHIPNSDIHSLVFLRVAVSVEMLVANAYRSIAALILGLDARVLLGDIHDAIDQDIVKPGTALI